MCGLGGLDFFLLFDRWYHVTQNDIEGNFDTLKAYCSSYPSGSQPYAPISPVHMNNAKVIACKRFYDNCLA